MSFLGVTSPPGPLRQSDQRSVVSHQLESKTESVDVSAIIWTPVNGVTSPPEEGEQNHASTI